MITHLQLQKNCPPRQTQVTEPYVHWLIGGVEQVVPGGGWLEGHGALQCQVVPMGPVATHAQLVPL